jgi:hybrid cluster-associated redox disulfide protein
MNAHPSTIRVFLRHRMACIGCAMGAFHTVADACVEHRLPTEDLLRELVEAAAAPGPADAAL